MLAILLRVVVLYMIILLGSIFLADSFKKKIDKTLIVSVLGIAVFMYIFSILNIMKIGVYLIAISYIVLGLFTIIRKIIKKEFCDFFRLNILTYGMGFFTFIFVGLMVISFNKVLPDWDNYTFWSYYDKYVYYNNTLNISSDYGMIVNYPPFPTVLEYFVMNIMGEYRQGLEAFIVELVCYLFFIPIFTKIKTKLGKVIVSLSVIVVPTIFYMLLFFKSAYPDCFLGLIIGFICYKYIKEKDKKFLTMELSLCFSILTITKPTGIYISIILIGVLLFFEIFKSIKNRKLFKFKDMKKIIIFTFIIIITFSTFSIYKKLNCDEVKTYTKPKFETSEIEYIINSFKVFFTGEGSDEEVNGAISIASMPYTIINYPIIYSPVIITMYWAVFIFVLFGTITYVLFKNKTKHENNFIFMLFSILIGFIMYIVALQLAYLAKFSEYEMLHHNGIDRYATTYILSILYFVFMMIIEFISIKKIRFIKNRLIYKIFKDILYLIILILIFTLRPINYLLDVTLNYHNFNKRQEVIINNSNDIVEYLKKFNFDEKDKILIIIQNTDRKLDVLIARYKLFPLKMTISEEFSKDGNLNIESFDKMIKDFNYVYIFTIDEYFEDNTKQYFEDENYIKENTLYKVNNNGRLEENTN